MDNRTILVSVVVPVYKVEKYIDRCVKSIQNQSLKEIEIILVDDGSPDLCGEICDGYAANDIRIKVIHKTNGGLSSARNAGMKVAGGKYIGFVDSDDDIDPKMYETMVQAAEKTGVDFVMSDYIRILQDNTSFLKTTCLREGLYTRDDILKKVFPQLIMGMNLDYGPLLSVCPCLYRREFLVEKEILFAEDIRWSEDNLFSSIVGLNSNSFYYIKNQGFYHYYQNMGTITTTFKTDAWNVYRKMNEYLWDYFKDYPEYNFSNQLYLHLVYYACNCIMQTKMLPMKDAKEIIGKILNDTSCIIALGKVKIGKVPIKLRIQLMLMKNKCIKIINRIGR